MSASTLNEWAEDEVELAARLWATGASSAGIARAIWDKFGVHRSRSAVCGLMMRRRDLFPSRNGESALRKARCRKQAPHPGNIRAKRAVRKQDPGFTPPAPKAEDPRAHNGASRAVPLVRLEAGECRFPVNNAAPGEEHLFCGAPAKPDCPYCAHHAARAYGGQRAEETVRRVLGGWAR